MPHRSDDTFVNLFVTYEVSTVDNVRLINLDKAGVQSRRISDQVRDDEEGTPTLPLPGREGKMGGRKR